MRAAYALGSMEIEQVPLNINALTLVVGGALAFIGARLGVEYLLIRPDYPDARKPPALFDTYDVVQHPGGHSARSYFVWCFPRFAITGSRLTTHHMEFTSGASNT